IRSADPLDPPAIYPNYLSTADDIGELLAGARFLRWLAAAKSLATIIAEELKPGPATTGDEALIDDIRARSYSVFHPSGTCRMGPDPASAVVDAMLRVHGVAGLRVIDSSIFPTLPSGNINGPSIMVGAKGADLVLDDLY